MNVDARESDRRQIGGKRLDVDLVAQSAECIETYAKMGERLGEAG